MRLDSIFARYPADGFQDIWFNALEPSDVLRLFNYACQTYGQQTAPRAAWSQFTNQASDADLSGYELQDIDYEFAPLVIGDIALEGVAIRIEDDSLAVDFNSGLEYWNPLRQTAFIRWLRELHRQVPNARLEWAREGGIHSPSEHGSELLRRAVANDIPDSFPKVK